MTDVNDHNAREPRDDSADANAGAAGECESNAPGRDEIQPGAEAAEETALVSEGSASQGADQQAEDMNAADQEAAGDASGVESGEPAPFKLGDPVQAPGDSVLREGEGISAKSRWYIVHTYSGFEQRVERTIREMIRTGQDQGQIEEVVVPTEKVIELVKGEKKTSTRKFYPGYVLIKMVLTDFSWHLVQSISRVTGFVGGRSRPTPMRDSEAKRVLSMMEQRQEQPRPKFHFDRGDEVRVIEGPFGGFNGVVEDVNYDKGKLRVSVSIFGRQTPVELDFVQVTKG